MINQTPAQKLVAMAQQLVEIEEQQRKKAEQDDSDFKPIPGEELKNARAEAFVHGEFIGSYNTAQQMRVLFCALITAHKREDHTAFWATVEIAKHQLSSWANFDAEDWALFRDDTKRKAIG